MTWPILTNVRLRTLSDTTGGDPATAQRQLEWNRAAADAVWRPLEVIGGTAAAFGASGATSAATGSATAPIATYPTGITKGQLLVLFVTCKPDTATVTTPAGWTVLTNSTATGGAGAQGADTGPTRGTIFVREADGTETGTFTLTVTSGNSTGVKILRYAKTTGKVWSLAMANGVDSSAGAAWSVTSGSSPGFLAGDILLVGTAPCSDCTIGTPTIAHTGVTFGTLVNRDTTAITTGNDTRVQIDEFPVNSITTPSGNLTFTFTASGTGSTTESGVSLFLRIRQVDAPIVLSLSSNIAAGGATATTAQLTAPSGKTSGANFGAGDISDDTNPLPTLDLATNQYTEDEWCLQATATAQLTEVYQFRVTLAGTPFATYTQTPTLTIGTAATGAFEDVATRLKLSIRIFEDVATRIRLTGRALRDVATRLKLTGRGFRDVATRLMLTGRAYKDVAARIKLTGRTFDDVETRVKLTGRAYKDVSTRLQLAVANAGMRDASTRLKLSVRAFKDTATRVKLGIQAYRDTATRLKLTQRAYRDASTRVTLQAPAVYRHVATRMVLQGGPGQLLITFIAPTLDEGGQPLPGDLDGFLVYYGTAPGVYGPPIDIGHITTYLLTGLIHGTTYYVAIRSYDTFGNQSALSAESSRAADPIGTLYPHLGDAATRFRLAVSTPHDVFTRFLLAARQWVHVATRLNLRLRGFRDTATRIKLTGRQYADAASRLRLTVSSLGMRDVASRLRLSVRSFRDASTRLRLILSGSRDVSSRLKLTALGVRDVASRLRLNAVTVRDVSTRIRLSALVFRDASSRIRLSGRQYKDASSRFRLAIANAFVRDAASRFRLRVLATRDTATRLMLGIRVYRDSATRLKLTGRGFRDVATRLKLTGRQTRDTASRAVLNVRAYRDTATRVKLIRRGYRDAALRFKLQLLQTPAWRDTQARFVLALPQLAPSLVFASMAQPSALVSTVNLLAWVSVSTPAGLESDPRVFLFAAIAQPSAAVSTLDLLSWTSASAPTALVSEAR